MAIIKALYLVEHDARMEGSFEKHYTEANSPEHAEIMLQIRQPDFDWNSGRFTTRVTWLQDL
jgi:hypothetical protein